MDKVEVFYFRIYDSRLDDFVRPERMSTKDRIQKIAGAELIADSSRLVPHAALDAQGRFDPRKEVQNVLFP